MQITWTKLPFPARNREEFSRGLNDWLGRVFYELLPARGLEVREEQIYTAFRIAKALADGKTLFAEAGAGTGKTFAYLLPAVCHARYHGRPAVVASATGVLQAQLTSPGGDIETLSQLLDLQIDARLAADPAEYLCPLKANRLYVERPMKGWKALHNWSKQTKTGTRQEVPDVSDELWSCVSWDPLLPCDTCRLRGTCHVMAARRHYRAAGDLVVTDHRFVVQDLLTRAERQAAGQTPLLPLASAVIFDEGHHLPETWQRAQGQQISAKQLKATLDQIAGFARQPGKARALAEARDEGRDRLVRVVLAEVRGAAERLLTGISQAALPGEGKRHIPRERALMDAAAELTGALERLQDELVTEEAMLEGTDAELTLRAYQDRLEALTRGLALFQSQEAVSWLEGEDLWTVPGESAPLMGQGGLPAGTPVLFSSATLEPDYAVRALSIAAPDQSRVGVPFNLAQQVLIYQPDAPGDEMEQTAAVIRAMQGRTLVLLNSMAEVERYRRSLTLPWRVLWEGEGERGRMLRTFRQDRSSVLLGATLWEGVDIQGEPLSCVIIPRLPFPAHDPLIAERRREAADQGRDPFLTVDLPEMLLKLKQGAGRLIRTARDRGVLAILDRSYLTQPWAGSVEAIFPDGAARTADLGQVAAFCPPAE